MSGQTPLPPLSEVLYADRQVSILSARRGCVLSEFQGSLIVVTNEADFQRWAQQPMALSHLENASGTTKLAIETLPKPVQRYWQRVVEQAQSDSRKIESE